MDRMSFGTEAQVSTTTIFFTVCLDVKHHCYALLGIHLEDIANVIASLFSHQHVSLMM